MERTVKCSFDFDELEEWVKDNNKVNNKIAKLEYLAVVVENEDAKKCWDDYKSGKISEDDFKIDNNEEITDSMVEAFKSFLLLIPKVFGVEPCAENKNLFDGVDVAPYVYATIKSFGKQLADCYANNVSLLIIEKKANEIIE